MEKKEPEEKTGNGRENGRNVFEANFSLRSVGQGEGKVRGPILLGSAISGTIALVYLIVKAFLQWIESQ